MSGLAFTKPAQLADGQSLEGFRCSDAIVDAWAEKHAPSARKRGTAVVYVTYCGGDVAGFYTLSTHSVKRTDVAGGWMPRNASDQIPAVLLGMLGIDEKYKGMGLGAQLLRDVIENALKVAAIAGAKALVVDPTGPDAEAFYEHFGFSRLPGTRRMAMSLRLAKPVGFLSTIIMERQNHC